jgi:GTP-binding protein
VFFGRSNVGKSSLVNKLLRAPGLARTSSTPGRTQTVNFYRVNEALHFVDLPGYGFAAAPEKVRRAWRPMVEGFLARWRGRIALAIVVLDARHPPTELDGTMREWLQAMGVPYLVAATKADKLSGNDRAQAQRSLARWTAGREGALLASARTGLGIREIWKHLDRALRPDPTEDGNERWTCAN